MKVKNNKGLLIYLVFLLGLVPMEWNAVLADKAPSENAQSAPTVGHGTIEAMDLKKHQLTIKHDAIKAIEWPAMTMAFVVGEKVNIDPLKIGATINFQLEKNKNGEMIITHIEKATP